MCKHMMFRILLWQKANNIPFFALTALCLTPPQLSVHKQLGEKRFLDEFTAKHCTKVPAKRAQKKGVVASKMRLSAANKTFTLRLPAAADEVLNCVMRSSQSTAFPSPTPPNQITPNEPCLAEMTR
ncbi:Uncharacterized protein TCM_014162 [Theobroma cacao]|uniref:Uncharacterized protein n=1 Tax=Theobroma cacao TaxID=3641 RepID=A0A061FXJ6_THECC|nr:Uncharacterized protein TCM_014162 [Theobroma cacao]